MKLVLIAEVNSGANNSAGANCTIPGGLPFWKSAEAKQKPVTRINVIPIDSINIRLSFMNGPFFFGWYAYLNYW